MKKQFITVALICLLMPILLRGLWFYRGIYLRIPPVEVPDYASIKIPQPTLSTPVDVSVKTSEQRITVLFDQTHQNRFTIPEISALVDRLLMLGAQVQITDNKQDLEEQLRSANSFVVIAPTLAFKKEELQAISSYIERGGRLLVIADPTRTYSEFYVDLEDSVLFANRILEPFGIAFQSDYVYNISRNEGNFRNIYAQVADTSELAKEIKEVVLYGTHSINGAQSTFLKADNKSMSSNTDQGNELTVGALAENGNVVVLGDMGFMTTPYYQVADNYRLILNIADFLASQARPRNLQDFPSLFTRPIVVLQNKEVEFDKDLLKQLAELQINYQSQGIQLSIAESVQDGRDLLVIGKYPPAEIMQTYLQPFGIDFNPPPATNSISSTPTSIPIASGTENPAATVLSTPQLTPTQTIAFPGSSGSEFLVPAFERVPSKGFSFVLYSQDERRNTLVLLAESSDKLLDLLKLINSGSLKGCLVQKSIAVCPGGVVSNGATAKPTSTPTPTNTPEPSAVG